MNTTFDFSEKVLEAYWIEKYGSVVKAVLKKQNKLISDTVEELYALYTNGIVRNKTGYDVELPNGILDEIKYTASIQGKSTLRVQGLATKEGKCDNIVIIDGINNRTFRVPTHIFFAFANLTISIFGFSSSNSSANSTSSGALRVVLTEFLIAPKTALLTSGSE